MMLPAFNSITSSPREHSALPDKMICMASPIRPSSHMTVPSLKTLSLRRTRMLSTNSVDVALKSAEVCNMVLLPGSTPYLNSAFKTMCLKILLATLSCCCGKSTITLSQACLETICTSHGVFGTMYSPEQVSMASRICSLKQSPAFRVCTSLPDVSMTAAVPCSNKIADSLTFWVLRPGSLAGHIRLSACRLSNRCIRGGDSFNMGQTTAMLRSKCFIASASKRCRSSGNSSRAAKNVARGISIVKQYVNARTVMVRRRITPNMTSSPNVAPVCSSMKRSPLIFSKPT
mmetsp:Transcript_22276/g.38098  ORF Transcript_22276/g.38098 Transcript_22276/m.38098 type:complete len:288 (+) Transcript_22276:2226-3089(+)